MNITLAPHHLSSPVLPTVIPLRPSQSKLKELRGSTKLIFFGPDTFLTGEGVSFLYRMGSASSSGED